MRRLETGKTPLGKGCMGLYALFSQLLCKLNLLLYLSYGSLVSPDVLIPYAAHRYWVDESQPSMPQFQSKHGTCCCVLPSTLLTSHLALLHFTHPVPLQATPHVTGLGRCGSLARSVPLPVFRMVCPRRSVPCVLRSQATSSRSPLTTLSVENNPNHFLYYHLPYGSHGDYNSSSAGLLTHYPVPSVRTALLSFSFTVLPPELSTSLDGQGRLDKHLLS